MPIRSIADDYLVEGFVMGSVIVSSRSRLDTDSNGDIDEKELHDWIKIQIMDFVERDAQKVRN